METLIEQVKNIKMSVLKTKSYILLNKDIYLLPLYFIEDLREMASNSYKIKFLIDGKKVVGISILPYLLRKINKTQNKNNYWGR